MDDDSKTCPVCGETIKKAAIKCRFCNTDLAEYQQKADAEVERKLFEGHPLVIYSVTQWLLAIVTLGIAAIVYWFRSRSITYTLSTQRIQIERGLLSTIKESVELFRIDDFDIHRPLGMRLLGHCKLHLRSSDPDLQVAMIEGIPNLDAIADTLRECSLRERQRRGITTFVKA